MLRLSEPRRTSSLPNTPATQVFAEHLQATKHVAQGMWTTAVKTAEQPCPPGASVLEMTPPPPVDPTTVPLAVVSVLSYTTPATLLLGGQPPPEVSAPSHNHVSICSPSASIFVSGTKAGDEFIRRKLLKDLIHFVQ